MSNSFILNNIATHDCPSWHSASRLLARPRLLQQLDHNQSPLFWISGPAGSGKSALIQSWLTQTKRPVFYYQLEASDTQASLLWSQLGLEELAPPVTRHQLSRQLQQLATGQLLILDNYQRVQHPQLDQWLMDMVEALPTDKQIIVISRYQAPASLVRLRAYQQLKQLEPSQLAFNQNESAALLQPYSQLTAEQAKHIIEQAAGWAAGLTLMAQQYPYYQRDLFDYFDREVFRYCDCETQQFLLDSSTQATLEQSALNQTSHLEQIGKMLRYLSAHHCFTQRDSQTGTYAYHPLFLQFLQTRARHSLASADQLPTSPTINNAIIEIYVQTPPRILIKGELLRFGNKLPKKPLELLIALIEAGGEHVSINHLADQLWPDSEGDAAYRSFKYTLHSLRKLLGHPDSLILSNAQLSLNLSLCWVDRLHAQQSNKPLPPSTIRSHYAYLENGINRP